MVDWNELVGKRIYFLLLSGHSYKGNVISLDDRFITIIDKYNEKVSILISEIKIFKEQEECQ